MFKWNCCTSDASDFRYKVQNPVENSSGIAQSLSVQLA